MSMSMTLGSAMMPSPLNSPSSQSRRGKMAQLSETHHQESSETSQVPMSSRLRGKFVGRSRSASATPTASSSAESMDATKDVKIERAALECASPQSPNDDLGIFYGMSPSDPKERKPGRLRCPVPAKARESSVYFKKTNDTDLNSVSKDVVVEDKITLMECLGSDILDKPLPTPQFEKLETVTRAASDRKIPLSPMTIAEEDLEDTMKDIFETPLAGHPTEVTRAYTTNAHLMSNSLTPKEPITVAQPRNSHDVEQWAVEMRELMNSKMAKLERELEQKLRSQIRSVSSAPIFLSMNLDFSGVKMQNYMDKNTKGQAQPGFLEGQKRVGPIKVNNLLLAANLQVIAIGIYAGLILGSAFLSPKTLILLLWRIALCLTLYAATLRMLGRTVDRHQDIFLAPFFYLGQHIQHCAELILDKVVTTSVTILADTMRHSIRTVTAEHEK